MSAFDEEARRIEEVGRSSRLQIQGVQCVYLFRSTNPPNLGHSLELLEVQGEL